MYATAPKINCPHIMDSHYDNFDLKLSLIKDVFYSFIIGSQLKMPHM
jgi:hypothetical protein